MIPIAGVLLLIIAAFSLGVVLSASGVFDWSVFGVSIPTTTAGVYLTGAGAMLVFVLALALLRRGIKRARERRLQVEALRRAAGVRSLPTSKRRSARRAPASPPADDGQGASGLQPTRTPPQGASELKPGADRTGASESQAASDQDPTSKLRQPAERDTPAGLGASSDPPRQARSSPDNHTSPAVEPPPGRRQVPDSLPPTTPAERQALLEEAEELTGDGSER